MGVGVGVSRGPTPACILAGAAGPPGLITPGEGVTKVVELVDAGVAWSLCPMFSCTDTSTFRRGNRGGGGLVEAGEVGVA